MTDDWLKTKLLRKSASKWHIFSSKQNVSVLIVLQRPLGYDTLATPLRAWSDKLFFFATENSTTGCMLLQFWGVSSKICLIPNFSILKVCVDLCYFSIVRRSFVSLPSVYHSRANVYEKQHHCTLRRLHVFLPILFLGFVIFFRISFSRLFFSLDALMCFFISSCVALISLSPDEFDLFFEWHNSLIPGQ